MSYSELFGNGVLPTIWAILKILVVALPIMGVVAYLTLAERKVIAYMHIRLGPNRVGPKGLLQPIADAIKLITKETIIPTSANRIVFVLAPIIALIPALMAWAVIPFTETTLFGLFPESRALSITDLNAGVLYVLAISGLGVYGLIIAGWASNSVYAIFGAMRSAALMISYEVAMGFTIIPVIMLAGSMNLVDIVHAQQGGLLNWYFIPLFPMFIVYFISVVAETNRAPFDVAEGESEIVAGFHVEYSAMMFGLFFLAEYANMILVSALATLLFLGGWMPILDVAPFNLIPGFIWFALKTAMFLFIFLWLRATFPRYRYDQIMRLGWKVFLPWSLAWIFVTGVGIHLFR
ncbi:MAG: NADH-quinone oxidoreductase subunit NuoH [Alphaproteobacteria bacterium CG_4_10_14_0_2_um_filter_63_37]|nr:MAG: NADH-quinone oxidoreductase subunit H [Proteobacteria bacterium CG1_02_64_396]PJA24025.1 MAG: NADH-quinone oxidoreductase subunit NuoH [Alphaproteobacteria bacterium CG_4_10_14_0_2_um_filter_63_37]